MDLLGIILAIILILVLTLFSIGSIMLSSAISREEEELWMKEFIEQYEETNGDKNGK